MHQKRDSGIPVDAASWKIAGESINFNRQHFPSLPYQESTIFVTKKKPATLTLPATDLRHQIRVNRLQVKPEPKVKQITQQDIPKRQRSRPSKKRKPYEKPCENTRPAVPPQEKERLQKQIDEGRERLRQLNIQQRAESKKLRNLYALLKGA